MSKRNLLWTSETSYIDLSENRGGVTAEMATRARCDYGAILGSLPDPDEVLRKMGKDLSVYASQLLDPHVGAVFDSRKAGTESKLWEINRGKSRSRQAKTIDAIFKKLRISNLINEILDCVYWGYQPIEVTWAYDGALMVPVKVQAKPAAWFTFNDSNELLLVTKQNPRGEPLPPRKFLLAQNQPKYDNPYGKRIAAMIFWYAAIKKNGLKWWATFCEKYGMPWLVGKEPRGTREDETNKLADLLENMVQDAIAVIPDDSSVEILETKAGSNGAAYEKLLNFCDASISKAFLGHSAGADATPGRLGGEDLAMEARGDLVQRDTELVCTVMDELIGWICELNWGPGVEQPSFDLYEEEDVDDAQAKRDEVLHRTGVRFRKEYYISEYGFDEKHIDVTDPTAEPSTQAQGTPAAGRTQPVELSEKPAASPAALAGQQDIEDLLESIPASAFKEQLNGPLKPVIELIESSAGYEDLLESLAGIYPAMNDTQLQRRLGYALTLSRIRGRLETQAGRE